MTRESSPRPAPHIIKERVNDNAAVSSRARLLCGKTANPCREKTHLRLAFECMRFSS